MPDWPPGVVGGDTSSGLGFPTLELLVSKLSFLVGSVLSDPVRILPRSEAECVVKTQGGYRSRSI